MYDGLNEKLLSKTELELAEKKKIEADLLRGLLILDDFGEDLKYVNEYILDRRILEM